MPHIDKHTQNVARTQTHTRTHVHAHARTHTHTNTLFPIALCLLIYVTRGLFSILPETLSRTARIPTQKQIYKKGRKKGLQLCSTGIRKFFSH